MTLPSIETALHAQGLHASDISEPAAQEMVYAAIEADLAEGVAYLRKYQSINWSVLTAQEERCIHCELPDIHVRKQVVRLASYHPLRRYVQDELGLLIALHNFKPTSSDGGPSGRLVVEPVERTMFNGKHVASGNLQTSPAHTWQVMQWGNTTKPPALLTEEEAVEKLWDYACAHLAGGLEHLRLCMHVEAGVERVDAEGSLIPEMIQLVGVPGMHAVVREKLGHSFLFYNCCGGKAKPKLTEGELLAQVSFKAQLLGQAHSEMMDC